MVVGRPPRVSASYSWVRLVSIGPGGLRPLHRFPAQARAGRTVGRTGCIARRRCCPGWSGGPSAAAGDCPRGSRDEPATLSTQDVSLEDHDGVGPLQGML